jgi:transposase
MDNASWHKRKTTNWHNWQPMYLPAYSPDLNPLECIWRAMKARWFNNHVCKNEEKLLERLDQTTLDIIASPEKTQQTTAIATLF